MSIMYAINLLSQTKTLGVEFIFMISLFTFILLFALVAGLVATKIGRSFRFWFWVSVPIPFIPLLVLLCLPENEEKAIVVPNDDLYDRLY